MCGYSENIFKERMKSGPKLKISLLLQDAQIRPLHLLMDCRRARCLSVCINFVQTHDRSMVIYDEIAFIIVYHRIGLQDRYVRVVELICERFVWVVKLLRWGCAMNEITDKKIDIFCMEDFTRFLLPYSAENLNLLRCQEDLLVHLLLSHPFLDMATCLVPVRYRTFCRLCRFVSSRFI